MDVSMKDKTSSNNVVEVLREGVFKNGAACAIRTADIELTFAEAWENVCIAANGLCQLGVSKGDVVAISISDPVDHLIAAMAIGHRGAVIISLAESMPLSLRQTLIKQTSAKFLLYSEESERAGLNKELLTFIRLDETDGQDLGDFSRPVTVDDHDLWQISHGSGSTGVPKLLPQTHKGQRLRCARQNPAFPFADTDSLLSLASIHFSATKGLAIFAWSNGATIFLGRTGQIDFKREVELGLVTVIYAAPFHIQRLVKDASQLPSRPYEKLRALLVSAAPVTMSMRADIRRFLTDNLYIAYGTNEASGCTITALDSVFDTEKTVGYPNPWITLQIVDDDDIELERGVSGQIRIKSEDLIEGYFKDSSSTDAAFKNGWFYPNDIGHLTEDGQLVFHGRADHMIMVGGVNVNPRQVENILLQDPKIFDAHVTSIPHPIAGEVPVALLVPAATNELELQRIVETVGNEIGKHSLHFAASLDKLPRSDLGKLPKKEVERLTQYLFGNPYKSDGSEMNSLSFSFVAETKAPQQDRLRQWIDFLAEPHTRPLIWEDVQQDPNLSGGRRGLEIAISLLHVLLHLIKAPVFERIQVNRCTSEGGDQKKWSGEIIAPSVDLIESKTFKAVMLIAFNYAGTLAKLDPTNPKHRNTAYEEIINKLFKQHPNITSRGLSTFHMIMKAQSMGVSSKILPNGITQLGWGRNSRLFDRSGTLGDSHIGAVYSGNKFNTAGVLHLAGLPTPIHFLVKTLEKAKKAAGLISPPLVLKPADGERGEGVTTDVTLPTLETAFTNAREHSKNQTVLVEKQVDGVCHRIFIAGDKLLYAVKRLPIGFYADGVSSIAELVEASHKEDQALAPWNRNKIPTLDALARDTIYKFGFDEEAVPDQNEFIPLRPFESTEWGGVDEDVTNIIHPDNIEIAIHASRVLGLSVVGVDIISPDISASWESNKAVINEVNYAPLLGGGEISRSHLKEYLDSLLPNLGQIPIHLFVGGTGALRLAIKQFNTRRSEVDGVFLMEGGRVRAPSGDYLRTKATGLAAQLRALSLHPDLAELLICVQTHKCLADLQELNAITSCTFADGEDLSSLYRSTTMNPVNPPDLLEALLAKRMNT